MRELIPYRNFERDEVFSCVAGLIKSAGQIAEESISEAASWYSDCFAKMAASAEKAGIAGNVWQSWLAMLIAEDENPFSLAHERRSELSGTVSVLAQEDLETLYGYMHYDLKQLDAELGVEVAGRLSDYIPSEAGSHACARKSGTVLADFAEKLRTAKSPEAFFRAVGEFYRDKGTGRYALNSGFRWDGRERTVKPASPLEEIRLDDLIGYKDQKKIIVDNTKAFLEGRPANNVLLYGEGGTGKSSTIKALLNEYASDGLRMIEVYKHQIEDLEDILEEIKHRNYKFILFMDDLSFEQFESEYKFLKAFIEGGLEKRPDNVLIYATSNRRHLMKETWADRNDKAEDMHESETQQEKMSLVDRFGLLVRYFSPEQEEYLNIVKTLAEEYGVQMQEEELEKGAIRWELKHGGFSGRSARQYIEYLAGHKNK